MLQEIVNVIIGLVLIMVPGFLLSVAIYPKKGSLDFWKRMGLSFGFGLMLIVMEGYLIARLDSLLTGTLFLATSVVTATLIVFVYLLKGIDLILSYVHGALGLVRGLFVNIRRLSGKLKRPANDKPKEVKEEPEETKEEAAPEKPAEHKGETETHSKK